MSDIPKFCKDCVHYSASPELIHAHNCLRAAARSLDIVTGKEILGSVKSARMEREVSGSENYCGPDGKFFKKQDDSVPF